MNFDVRDYVKSNDFEVTNGTDNLKIVIPQRTKKLYEALIDIENTRSRITEFEYSKKVIELLAGKDTFKTVNEWCGENLDFLMNLATYIITEFCAEKTEAEAREMEKSAEKLSPITDKFNSITPLIEKIK